MNDILAGITNKMAALENMKEVNRQENFLKKGDIIQPSSKISEILRD